jgi:hypothetical protein
MSWEYRERSSCREGHDNGPRRGEKIRGGLLLVLIIIIAGIPTAGAAQVTLSTPQSEYYVLAGQEAVIPLTIVSTYDHDVTGTLGQVMVPVPAGPDPSGSRGTSVQSRAFSAFTDTRTVSIPVGKSDVPADYLLTLTFRYPDNGGRSSTLSGIPIHFVTTLEETPVKQKTLTGTDIPDPGAGTSSGGSSPQENTQEKENTQTATPATALQNNQMPQDMSALRNQMAEEQNKSVDAKKELQTYITADPIMISLDRELTGAGFALNKTGIAPDSNRSGNFLLTYSSGPRDVAIRGAIRETRITFAEESSNAPVPLPGVLLNNATYHGYTDNIAGKGFLRNQTRVNITTDTKTVDLAYTNPNDRILHLHAAIQNGTITTITVDNPDDLLASAMPILGFTVIILISSGIWYLARIRPVDLPIPGVADSEPAARETPREIAWSLLDEAERDAARDSYPEAYRKTGRAIRIILSHEPGHGGEFTSGDVERLISSCAGNPEKIRGILDRCMTVGFAKDTPDSGEFREMIRYTRTLLAERFREKVSRDPEDHPGNLS